MKTVRKYLTVSMLGAYIAIGFVGIIAMIIIISDAFTAMSVLRQRGLDPKTELYNVLYVMPSAAAIVILGFAIAGAISYIRADMFSDTPKRENRVLRIWVFISCIFLFTRIIQWFYFAKYGATGSLTPIFHLTFYLPLVAIIVFAVRIYFDGKNAIVSRILAGVVHLLCMITSIVALVGGGTNAFEVIFYILMLLMSGAGIAYHLIVSPWQKYIQ